MWAKARSSKDGRSALNVWINGDEVTGHGGLRKQLCRLDLHTKGLLGRFMETSTRMVSEVSV